MTPREALDEHRWGHVVRQWATGASDDARKAGSRRLIHDIGRRAVVGLGTSRNDGLSHALHVLRAFLLRRAGCTQHAIRARTREVRLGCRHCHCNVSVMATAVSFAARGQSRTVRLELAPVWSRAPTPRPKLFMLIMNATRRETQEPCSTHGRGGLLLQQRLAARAWRSEFPRPSPRSPETRRQRQG